MARLRTTSVWLRTMVSAMVVSISVAAEATEVAEGITIAVVAAVEGVVALTRME